MANFNLSDAAKNILLGEDSKSTFDSNISGKMSQRLQDGNRVGLNRIDSKTAYGTNDAGKIGDAPNDVNDPLPDYTKGAPTATPPGATPPVSSQPMMKLKNQPGQDKAGDVGKTSDAGSHQGTESTYDQIRDRVAAKLAKQTMAANAGATFQSYGEESEVEYDDEEIIVEAEKEEEGHEDAAQDKAMMQKMLKKEKMKEKMKEDIDALMSGENLSEEFVSKATTIFEAAVIARAEEVIAEAEEQLMEEFEIAVESIKEDLASKVDDYLNYMVEEWMKDNELAIQSGLKAEITEEFLTGLRDLFIEHNIDIPEDKVDIVEELAAQLEATEAVLNEEIARGVELSKALNEQKKIEAIYTACEGLTQTQVEKMKSLAEGVDFTTEEEFSTKLETLKESYFRADVKVATTDALDDEVLLEEEKKSIKSSDSEIDYYAKTISQTLVK
jgi:hypothetical protein